MSPLGIPRINGLISTQSADKELEVSPSGVTAQAVGWEPSSSPGLSDSGPGHRHAQR